MADEMRLFECGTMSRGGHLRTEHKDDADNLAFQSLFQNRTFNDHLLSLGKSFLQYQRKTTPVSTAITRGTRFTSKTQDKKSG